MASFLPVLAQEDVARAAQVCCLSLFRPSAVSVEALCYPTFIGYLRMIVISAALFLHLHARGTVPGLGGVSLAIVGCRIDLSLFLVLQLIQQTYSPQTHLQSEEQRRLQQELYEIQRRQESWGLVLPFLNHPDPNVQFFGAHTLQVKIARDWYVHHSTYSTLTHPPYLSAGIAYQRILQRKCGT